MNYTITRENNKYNRSMKWQLLGVGVNGSKFSTWYKTKQEAENKIIHLNSIEGKFTTVTT